MKVLLINPTGGPEEEYAALSKAGTELPQLGLAYVANSMKSDGHTVRVIDCHLQNFTTQRIVELVKNDGYAMVGISVYITTVHKTHKIASAVKADFPHVTICVGGPQATLDPHDFCKPYIDYVFKGEADYSINALIKSIERRQVPPDLPGLLQCVNGTLKGNHALSLMENLDELPLLNLKDFYDLSQFYPPIHIRGHKAINVVSVRGCPFNCTFCAAAEVNGRRVRSMSVARFVDQIEHYSSDGFDSIMVYDDTFTINKKRAVAISEELIRRKIDIVWNCWSRVDCVDHETLSAMRASGCYLIMFEEI